MLGMARYGCQLLETTRPGWKWQIWLEMAGKDWKWTKEGLTQKYTRNSIHPVARHSAYQVDCRATGQKLSCMFEQFQSDNFAQISSRLNKGEHVRFKSNHIKDILNKV